MEACVNHTLKGLFGLFKNQIILKQRPCGQNTRPCRIPASESWPRVLLGLDFTVPPTIPAPPRPCNQANPPEEARSCLSPILVADGKKGSKARNVPCLPLLVCGWRSCGQAGREGRL